MAKAKHKKHGKAAHAHAAHGHGDAGHDDHDDHAHDEPLPPPEPETPLWFTLLGGVLFLVLGLVFLVFNGDDVAKGEGAETTKRPGGTAVAAQAADTAAKRPPAPPVRRLLPGDLEKKR